MLEISNGKIEENELATKVYALKTISSARTGKRLARVMVVIFILIFLSMFLPWQQNIEATGFVTALRPQDRPQKIESAIAGRIKEWRVQEGQLVKKGDTIVVLSEVKTDYFDPKLIERTSEQKEAKKQGIEATSGKVKALEDQIASLQQALNYSLQKAENKVLQMDFKVKSAEAAYQAQQANLQIAERQFKSYNTLYQTEGNAAKDEIPLVSRTEWEKRKQKLQEVKAKVVASENKYLEAKNEYLNATIQLNSIQADYQAKLAKSASDKSATLAYLAEAGGELSKINTKLANLTIRNDQYQIIAPQDGYIVKALKAGIGEMIKENGAICSIMPEKPFQAVELYVRARDVTLLSIGRKVRLEFDGFPALQVSGWPSVSVGTFGGEIAVIDFVDSKEGKYRILVVPDKKEGGWPQQVRMGSGVYGWVMLDNVSLWYEVWRQLNGFPPSLYDKPDKDGKEGEEERKKKKSGQKIKLKIKK